MLKKVDCYSYLNFSIYKKGTKAPLTFFPWHPILNEKQMEEEFKLTGFFISWEFGSCFMYMAQKVNVIGGLCSLSFIGMGVGSIIVPIISGLMFTSR